MAKTQIKYITRDNNEIMEFRSKNNFLDDFDVDKFLDNFNNLGLIYYKFSKIAGCIFISNDEETRTLSIAKCYLLNNEDLKDIVSFLSNKFKFYKFVLDTRLVRNSSFYKMYEFEKKENSLVIHF